MELADEPLNVYHARVRSHQTDLNAAMYHGAYLDLFDDARIETFRRMGYTYERMLAGNWGIFIRTVHCEFHAPAFMDDLISGAGLYSSSHHRHHDGPIRMSARRRVTGSGREYVRLCRRK